jgi:hypothetical protein
MPPRGCRSHAPARWRTPAASAAIATRVRCPAAGGAGPQAAARCARPSDQSCGPGRRTRPSASIVRGPRDRRARTVRGYRGAVWPETRGSAPGCSTAQRWRGGSTRSTAAGSANQAAAVPRRRDGSARHRSPGPARCRRAAFPSTPAPVLHAPGPNDRRPSRGPGRWRQSGTPGRGRTIGRGPGSARARPAHLSRTRNGPHRVAAPGCP